MDDEDQCVHRWHNAKRQPARHMSSSPSFYYALPCSASSQQPMLHLEFAREARWDDYSEIVTTSQICSPASFVQGLDFLPSGLMCLISKSSSTSCCANEDPRLVFSGVRYVDVIFCRFRVAPGLSNIAYSSTETGSVRTASAKCNSTDDLERGCR